MDSKHIYNNDRKVGIKRERETHTAEEGNLYSISMVRLEEDIKIGVLVNGLPGNLEPSTPYLTKFGGEGKVCMVEIGNGGIPLAAKDKEISVKKNDLIKLVFLSPTYFGRKWHLPGFVNPGSNGADCREGDIAGAKMRLVSACIDKPYKIGGWDVKAGKSKPIRSFIPAGSVYYLEAIEDKVIPSEGKLGDMTKTGFGHYALGRWTNV
jgi:CRISPR-associated protein Cmr3